MTVSRRAQNLEQSFRGVVTGKRRCRRRGPRRRDPSPTFPRAPRPASICVIEGFRPSHLAPFSSSLSRLPRLVCCPRIPSPLTFWKIRGARIRATPLFYFEGSISLLSATPSSILVVLGGNFTVVDWIVPFLATVRMDSEHFLFF